MTRLSSEPFAKRGTHPLSGLRSQREFDMVGRGIGWANTGPA
jgi:hypothetical protein